MEPIGTQGATLATIRPPVYYRQKSANQGKIEGTYGRGFLALAASNVLRTLLVEQILGTECATENSLKMLEDIVSLGV